MADQGESPVLVNRQPHLLALVLNRPRVLNTLNLEMIRLLRRALEDSLADGEVRLVLFEGARESRDFAPGATSRNWPEGLGKATSAGTTGSSGKNTL